MHRVNLFLAHEMITRHVANRTGHEATQGNVTHYMWEHDAFLGQCVYVRQIVQNFGHLRQVSHDEPALVPPVIYTLHSIHCTHNGSAHGSHKSPHPSIF